ncbi:MAG: hypothetical protein UHH95_00885 [Oscillospiraceae bacterium]|nr:hypothetical protein [Oscillospiraceae bacterium]
MSAKKAVCDLNCFDCKFEDCINDRLEIDDFRLVEEMDKTIIDQRKEKKAQKLSKYALERKKAYKTENPEDKKAYAQAYYSLNRERYKKYRRQNRDRKSAYDRDYFSRNREEINKKHRIYGLKNKERLRERQKEWREKNRDKIKEYQRQYYLRKKEENK